MKVDGRLAALIWLAALLSSHGCGRESVADAVAAQQVYFDLESKRAVAAEAMLETPAVNPVTGRRTLMPALYCAQCRAWRAAPPLEEVQRNPEARRCPKCGGATSAEGPLPDEEI